MKKALFLLNISSILVGLPTQLQIVSGNAQIDLNTEFDMHIQVSHEAELNWDKFSIGENESVQFQQPATDSCVLNRVTGCDPSLILGALKANGKIVLINPNSIVFGVDSQINVGALTASSLDSVNDAHKGRGSIQNMGQIRGSGELTFVGQRVENRGAIRSEAGKVTLFSRSESNESTYTSNQGRSLLENFGDLRGFEIELISDHDLHLGGTLNASSLSIHSNGRAEISCELMAPGGTVTVSGHRVDLLDGSLIDVSGEFGGGTIFLGKPKAIDWIHVAPNAKIRADALQTGNGGSVAIFARKGVDFQGEIYARGGAFGGNGGEAEVSTLSELHFNGMAYLTASRGNAGTLLIDPTDVVLNGPPTTAGVAVGNPTTLPAVTPVNIDVAAIIPILDGGSNVTITTASVQGGSGDITVNNALLRSGTGNLSLLADRDIIFNANCENVMSTGNFTAIAQRNVSVNSCLVGSVQGDVFVQATTGDVVLNAATSSAVIGYGSASFVIDALANVDVRAGNDILVLSGVSSAANATISKCGPAVLGGRNVGTIANPTNVTLTAGRDIQVLAGNASMGAGATVGNVMASATLLQYIGDVTLNAGRDIYVLGRDNFAVVGVRLSPSAIGARSVIRFNVGRDFVLGGNPVEAVPGDSGGQIGGLNFNGAGLGTTSANFRTSIYANVGRNFLLDGQGGFAFCTLTNDGALPAYPAEMFIHVGKDLILRGGDASSGSGSAAMFDYMHTSGVSQFWVGGSIYALNGSVGGAHLHVSISLPPGSLQDIGAISARASGDIRVAGGAFARASGTLGVIDEYYASGGISYIADSSFAPGELWPAQTAIVGFINVFTATPLQFASNPILSNGLGAVAFDHNFYDTNLQPDLFTLAALGVGGLTPLVQTGPGNLITYGAQNGSDLYVASRPQFADGTTADFLNIGTLPTSNMIQFSNETSGAFAGPGVDITLFGWNDVAISGNPVPPTPAPAVFAPIGDVFILCQDDMTLFDMAMIEAGNNVDLICDNQAPIPPLIGPGSFSMDATSSISAFFGYIRVYTARQEQNLIDPLAQFIIMGVPFFFTPGALFEDTNQEKWCTYYPFGDQGIPFKIFYKPCLQLITQQAVTIIDEFLFRENSFNYDIGWWLRFTMDWARNSGPTSSFTEFELEPYFIRKVQTPHYDNHPKSYTSSSWR